MSLQTKLLIRSSLLSTGTSVPWELKRTSGHLHYLQEEFPSTSPTQLTNYSETKGKRKKERKIPLNYTFLNLATYETLKGAMIRKMLFYLQIILPFIKPFLDSKHFSFLHWKEILLQNKMPNTNWIQLEHEINCCIRIGNAEFHYNL